MVAASVAEPAARQTVASETLGVSVRPQGVSVRPQSDRQPGVCPAPMLHDLGACGCPTGRGTEPAGWTVEARPLCVAPALHDLGLCPCAPAAEDLDSGWAPGETQTPGQQLGDQPAPRPRAQFSPAAATVEFAPHPGALTPVAAAVAGIRPVSLTWSEYEADLRARGAAADEEHGLWCPPDCPCGFSVPDDVLDGNPLLGLVAGSSTLASLPCSWRRTARTSSCTARARCTGSWSPRGRSWSRARSRTARRSARCATTSSASWRSARSRRASGPRRRGSAGPGACGRRTS
jgi:hypothetical protein